MSKKILLVEDEAPLAINEAQMLKKHGYEVITAYNGEKAVETVDSDREISLILMDIDLGRGMDGTIAAHSILQKHDLPIVFLTSHSEKEYVDRVKDVTEYGYVLKNSGEFVLVESIHMAYQLFYSRNKLQDKEEQLNPAIDQNGAPHRLVATHGDLSEYNRTERALHEKALRESEKKYRSITENASDIIIQVDDKLKTTYISHSVTEILGYTADDVYGRTILDFLPPADREKIEKMIEEGIDRKEKQTTNTHRAYTKSGKIRWMETKVNRLFDENGQFTGATYIARDITELRKLEQLNKERRQHLEALLGATPNAIISFDSRNRINEWNRGAEELFHYTREEVLGRDVDEIVGKQDDPVYEEALSFTRKAVTGKGVPPTETVRFTKEGDPLPVIVAGSPIMVDGKFTGVVVTYTDISRLTQKEKEVETLLDEKEQLLHEVHHRIKNHMSTISSIISLRASHIDDPDIREVLDEVQHKIDLMQNIYQTLYTGDDINTIYISSFLAPLLQDIQSTYITTQPISISTDIEDIEVTSKQSLPIGIIITELITNSIKYAFEENGEGKIRISIYRDGENPEVLCIEVSDNGKGMPSKVVEEGEYGFGLTLVEAYTVQFDGTMSISGEGGTHVRVVLVME
ncbi:MAG: PAS domain S-box protein [Spirochaetia bacterium]